MASLKVTVEGVDRKILLTLVKTERQNIKVKTGHVVSPAQVRAVDFYNEHLIKLQKRLDPNNKYIY